MKYDPRNHLPAGHRFFARVAQPAKAGAKEGHIYVYDVIGDGWFGGVSPKAVADALEEMGDVKTIHIYINSPGGNVFDANAIYENIKRHKARKIVHVDGLAASAASILAMVGDEIITSAGGMWMIHEPWTVAIGAKKDMLDAADMLDKVRGTLVNRYAARTKQTKDQISSWMEEETWMDAAEAKERGFTDEVTEEEESVEEEGDANGTLAILDSYKNTPPKLRAKARDSRTLLAHMEMRVASLKKPKAAEEDDEEEKEDPAECGCEDDAIKPCGCCKNCHGANAECKCDSKDDKDPCGCCGGCSKHPKAENKVAGPARSTTTKPGQPGSKK